MIYRSTENNQTKDIQIPKDIDWHMLDKSKFFFLGAALFSGVSSVLYPAVVLKTKQQVSPTNLSCLNLSLSILRLDGPRGFYRGFGTSLMGTIPARALYMSALEVTKSTVGPAVLGLGLSTTSASAIANAVAGMSSAVAAQLVWTPVDVVSQRLMVQGGGGGGGCYSGSVRYYNNGIDAFKKILFNDGVRGLYRGFGISIWTYAPSNAVWWATYSVSNRLIWRGINGVVSRTEGLEFDKSYNNNNNNNNNNRSNSSVMIVGVQGLCAAMASGFSALITMPLDTIKTRLQVLDGVEEDYGIRTRTRRSRRRPLTVVETVRSLVKEGGFGACYKGLGPRWVSMSMSAAIMVTTYEFLKRLSTKNSETCGS